MGTIDFVGMRIKKNGREGEDIFPKLHVGGAGLRKHCVT